MAMRELLDDCIHCGFCLTACPTYLTDGQEMDSPRGRIYLMDLVERGEIPLDRTVGKHIDACLGCLACVTACPSGVQYDRLLADTRARVEHEVPRTAGDRAFRALVLRTFPYPRRLRLAVLFGWVYQRLGLPALVWRLRLPQRLRAVETLLPPVRLRRERLRRLTPAVGRRRRRVALLAGCAQRVLFSHVNAATARVLAAEGCEVLVPRGQACCGALDLHTGREQVAAKRARRTIATFERYDVDDIVVNVAGCGSALKEYGQLLRDDPAWRDRAAALVAKVKDVHELLAELPPVAPRHPVPARVAYHDACHLAHAQGVRAQPRRLLGQVPGLILTDLPEADVCCGSAGVYNLVQPTTAAQLGRRKADHIRSATPDIVATGNAGCLLQLRRFLGDDMVLVHPIEILDASIRGTSL